MREKALTASSSSPKHISCQSFSSSFPPPLFPLLLFLLASSSYGDDGQRKGREEEDVGRPGAASPPLSSLLPSIFRSGHSNERTRTARHAPPLPLPHSPFLLPLSAGREAKTVGRGRGGRRCLLRLKERGAEKEERAATLSLFPGLICSKLIFFVLTFAPPLHGIVGHVVLRRVDVTVAGGLSSFPLAQRGVGAVRFLGDVIKASDVEWREIFFF